MKGRKDKAERGDGRTSKGKRIMLKGEKGEHEREKG